ncbi:hypothetical protein CK936_23515 [Streptomyces albireticuli]|uniref:Uncharacterized protein n=1 Tax=Streptomyces albireticuli TaxID=1940 RepID=A0A2A2D255_9ACTN|nr:hypothetical protein CK936_23515 [Streptomyces albireticuli]
MTFTEIAQRVNERGLVSRPITRQGVRYIADHDPNWPTPPGQWIKAGSAWVMLWEPIEKFFSERTARGRGPVTRPAESTSEGSEPEQ